MFGHGDVVEAASRDAASAGAGSPATLTAEAGVEAVAGEGRRTALAAAPEAALATDEARAEAAQGLFLDGVVVDDRGSPVPGAWLVSQTEAVPLFADDEGRFRMPVEALIGERGSFQRQLHAWAPGHEFVAAQVWVGEPAVVVLRPQDPIKIKVVRAAGGMPIEGARVLPVVWGRQRGARRAIAENRWIESPAPAGVTDAAGIAEIPTAENCGLLVTAAGYRSVDSGLWGNGRETEDGVRLIVEMPAASELPVRLLYADGTPLAGAEVGFGMPGEAVPTDAEGWFEVPDSVKSGFWQMRVQLGTRGWIEIADQQRYPDNQLRAGQEIVIGHQTRKGALDPAGRGAPADFELATAAGADGWGNQVLPDARRDPELLHWAVPGPDGEFTLQDGWQGTRTYLLVRSRADGELVHQQELIGAGPWPVRLPAAAQATLRFRIDPESYLDGATAVIAGEVNREQGLFALGYAGSSGNHGSAGSVLQVHREVPLEDGVVVVPLPPGPYTVRLRPVDPRQPEFAAADFEMPDHDHEQEFDLGVVRAVTGTVTAAGAPVPACRVYLRGPDQRIGLRTDSEGRWAAEGLPTVPCTVSIRPDDPWLAGSTTTWELGAAQTFLPIEIEVGHLRLAAAAPSDWRAAALSISRQMLGPVGGRNFQSGRRNGSPLVPDLAAGPAEFVLAPSRINFVHLDPFRRFEPETVEVQAGGRESVLLREVELGVVVVEFSGHPGWIRGNVGIEPASPGLEAPETSRGGPAGYRGLRSWKLDPGTWRLRADGPFQAGWNRDAAVVVPAGATWSDQVEVRAGWVTRIILDWSEAEGMTATMRTTE